MVENSICLYISYKEPLGNRFVYKKFGQNDNQGEIQNKEKELVEPILKKVRTVIEGIAQEKGYTMIFERQGQNIIWAQKEADLTDAVVQAFEKAK